jgi:hypothetical protein
MLSAQGTTDVPHDYAYVDSAVTSGTWYYRVKLTGERGEKRFTEPVRVDVVGGAADVPHEFALFQNYPNPFNPATHIQFTVAVTGKATLRLYNVLGQEVRTLFNGVAEAGKRLTVTVNGSNLATGVYIYRLESNGRSDARKLILMK